MGHLNIPGHPNFKQHVGQIMLVDTKANQTKAVSLDIQGLDRETFSPHGISLWKDIKSGEISKIKLIMITNSYSTKTP